MRYWFPYISSGPQGGRVGYASEFGGTAKCGSAGLDSLLITCSDSYVLPGPSPLWAQPLEALTTFWKGWHSYFHFIGEETVAQRWKSLGCILQVSFLCVQNNTQNSCDTDCQCCVSQIFNAAGSRASGLSYITLKSIWRPHASVSQNKATLPMCSRPGV